MTELTPTTGGTSPGSPRRSLTKRLSREPLVHFLLAGLALFVVYHFTQGNRAAEEPSRIELTADDLRRMETVWAARWRRPPTAAELQGLIEDDVRQEILARQAIALGLDKGDIIIQRRLAQKLEFLVHDVAALRESDAKELAVWFEKNRERFALPPRASFQHIYFSPDQRGQRARKDAAQALAGFAGKSVDAVADGELGDRFMLQSSYGNQTPEQIRQLFGDKFAEALFKLPSGSWQGPVESGYGWHLVWVESLTQGSLPAFAEVETAVKAEWLAEQQAEAGRMWYKTLRDRYEIVLPRVDAAGPVANTPRSVEAK
jgi:peptidyl-prolyl cis-trans isomerase C